MPKCLGAEVSRERSVIFKEEDDDGNVVLAEVAVVVSA